MAPTIMEEHRSDLAPWITGPQHEPATALSEGASLICAWDHGSTLLGFSYQGSAPT